jgi:hypothetical protein
MLRHAGHILLSETEGRKWTARHKQFSKEQELAGLFRGWVPNGYADSQTRILYVGKATSGEFAGDSEERESFNKGGSAFWNFARQIAREIGCDDPRLPCIAWSNISKISIRGIEARPELVKGFEDQATSTLEYEIGEANPHVVVFVTMHFSDEVVQRVAEWSTNAVWSKSEEESSNPKEHDIWYRRRQDGRAVLWMRHPMHAYEETLDFAAKKIASLVKYP